MSTLDRLQDRLGHRFTDPTLLERALTHRSHSAEQGEAHNERLEFLGDAVLGLAVTAHLFDRHPELPEGQLAKARAATVSKERCAEIAVELDVGAALRLGRGEQVSGGHEKESILGDAMEALLGAVYLDAGFAIARDVTLAHFAAIADEMAGDPGARDYKTRLQERLAVDGLVPDYRVRGEGPDHARSFVAEVLVAGSVVGSGAGTSKKEAQQLAAREALAHLG